MGDINCDIGDASPGARAWAQPLSGTGYVSIDRVGHGEWGQCPTRVPWGAQSGQARHIDAVLVSGPGMVRYDPRMVSIGTDTELDTPGYMGHAPQHRGRTALASALASSTSTRTTSLWCGSLRPS